MASFEETVEQPDSNNAKTCSRNLSSPKNNESKPTKHVGEVVQPALVCRHDDKRCQSVLLSKQDVHRFHENFHAESSKTKQDAFIMNAIHVQSVCRKPGIIGKRYRPFEVNYYVTGCEGNKVKVCAKTFCSVLCVQAWRVRRLAAYYYTKGMARPGPKGVKHPRVDKIKEKTHEHIQSFDTFGQYGREKVKRSKEHPTFEEISLCKNSETDSKQLVFTLALESSSSSQRVPSPEFILGDLPGECATPEFTEECDVKPKVEEIEIDSDHEPSSSPQSAQSESSRNQSELSVQSESSRNQSELPEWFFRICKENTTQEFQSTCETSTVPSEFIDLEDLIKTAHSVDQGKTSYYQLISRLTSSTTRNVDSRVTEPLPVSHHVPNVRRKTTVDNSVYQNTGYSCSCCGMDFEGLCQQLEHRCRASQVGPDTGALNKITVPIEATRYNSLIAIPPAEKPHVKEKLLNQLNLDSKLFNKQFSQKNECITNSTTLDNKQKNTRKKKAASHLCELCGKYYTRRETLREHISTVHNRVKPFQCQICNIKMASRSNFKNHLRVHSREFTHKCTICEKGYTNSHGLKNHKLKHHELVID